MMLIEFLKVMEKKYTNKDFSDEKVIRDINFDICNYLCGLKKKGELCAEIYKGKYNGETIVDIAKRNNVSVDVVQNCLIKIRLMVEWLKNKGIKLEKFSNFEIRKYRHSEETLEKFKQRRKDRLNRQ